MKPTVFLCDLGFDDLPDICRWRKDPEVAHHLSNRLRTLDEVRAWFERIRFDTRNLLQGIRVDGRLLGYTLIGGKHQYLLCYSLLKPEYDSLVLTGFFEPGRFSTVSPKPSPSLTTNDQHPTND